MDCYNLTIQEIQGGASSTSSFILLQMDMVFLIVGAIEDIGEGHEGRKAFFRIKTVSWSLGWSKSASNLYMRASLAILPLVL